MTKKDFVNELQDRLKDRNIKVSKEILSNLINEFGSTVVDCVARYDSIHIDNLGTFTSQTRKSHQTTCHFDGDAKDKTYTVPAKVRPKFLPSSNYTLTCERMVVE